MNRTHPVTFADLSLSLRMGRLRVCNRNTSFVLSPTIIDSAIDNVSLEDLSPISSPEERVIRLRGKKNLSLNWSPGKIPQNSNMFNSTPKKTTNMQLRSSPRKRVLFNEYSPSSTTSGGGGGGVGDDSSIYSPYKQHKNSPRKTYGLSSPVCKRLRFEQPPPMAQFNRGLPLDTILKGLTSDQLIDIIKDLVKCQPELEHQIRMDIPIPDIRPFEEELRFKKRNILKSLPSSSMSSSSSSTRLMKTRTDGFAYSRAKLHLDSFKKSIIEQCLTLHDSRHWDALLDYTIMAWQMVHETPIWDNNSHNGIRRYCFKYLTWQISNALKHGSIFLGEKRLLNLADRIYLMQQDYVDMAACNDLLNNLLRDLKIN